MVIRAHMRAGLVAVAVATGVLGCKSEPPRAGSTSGSASALDAPRNPGASGSATVTYRGGVHVIEHADGYDALVSVSTDGSTLVFDRTLGRIPAMRDGDVFVVKGLLARRVVASASRGNELAVLTIPAGLTDIVSDAKIHVESPIRFGAARSAASRGEPHPIRPLRSIGDALVPPLYAQSPADVRQNAAEAGGRSDAFGNVVSAPYKALIEGWDTEFSATPSEGRLELSMQLKKSIANATAVITGKGYLADFDFSSDIDVERGTVERLQLAYKKLNGMMNFTWEVQTTAKGALRGNAKMKLPAVIEIPLYQYLGGLPLFLEVSSAVLIKPAFGAQYEFSRGGFRITYDGYQSFRAKDGNVDADGNVTGNVELGTSEAGGETATGIVVAFAAPRIELNIGMSKILKFTGIKEAAAKADEYLDELVTSAFGAEALAKLKSSPMGQVSGGNVVEAAMGSGAAAWIELTTSSGQSHSGAGVMVPCTRTDVHITGSVGTSAKAFGVSVGDADKEIFRKDITRVVPSEDALCKNL